jgi:hypothetical protein
MEKKMEYTHRYTHRYKGFILPAQTPQPTQLTPQGQQILDVLRDAGDWVGRATLAGKMKKSLNKWDIALLGKLASAGLIETRKIPHHGPIGYEWQYRAVSVSPNEGEEA